MCKATPAPTTTSVAVATPTTVVTDITDTKSIETQSITSSVESVDSRVLPKRRRIGKSIKKILKQVVDATILNTHPCGAPIDGSPRLNGNFAKEVVNATVLNTHPAGAPIDSRMGGRFSPANNKKAVVASD